MRTALISAFSLVSSVLASFDTWAPPGPYDVRAPCPMLNTLANHGFLPHHGMDITREQTMDALFESLHINKSASSFLFDFALTTNPEPNATTFSLNDLGRHNILEHDASLSRSDAYFGNVLTFNHTVFEETKMHWGPGDTLDIEAAARARLGRINTSKATNPEHELSELGDAFTYGESIAYIVFIGDKYSGTANRSWVEYLFEHERLPIHFGWERPADMFSEDDLFEYMDLIRNITKTLPGSGPPVERRRFSHFGW